VADSTPEDVELALDAAHAAKDAWGEASATERAKVLNAIADAIEKNQDVLRGLRHRLDEGDVHAPPVEGPHRSRKVAMDVRVATVSARPGGAASSGRVSP
jgi:hypothetical protein